MGHFSSLFLTDAVGLDEVKKDLSQGLSVATRRTKGRRHIGLVRRVKIQKRFVCLSGRFAWG